MKFVIYLLGFAWIAAGTFAILYTDKYRAYLKKWMATINRIWLALVPAIAGLLLVLGAASTSHRGFISLIGVLAIAKGILIYFNPRQWFEACQNWIEGMSDQGYRLIGIMALVLGTVVLSWIQ